MNIVIVILLAIVEGITEFLPISSTGHLTLMYSLLKIESTDFTKSFEIVVQLGAILAVMVIYYKRLIVDRNVLKKVLIAFIPSAAISYLLYKPVKGYLIDNSLLVIVSLFIGGVVLILFEKYHHHNTEERPLGEITLKTAILIGLFQLIALIPGVSRSASTIVGALLLGENKKNAVEFSFLLAIPTMFAATGYDLLKTNSQFTPNEYMLMGIGILVAFISAMFAIKFFLKYVQDHSFTSFGIYRIIVAVIMYIVLFQS